jgi:anti-sigma B factor antagonist
VVAESTTAPRLRTGALELIEHGHRHLIVDLTGVTFCDSPASAP